MNVLYMLIVVLCMFIGVVMVIAGIPGTFVVWAGVFLVSLLSDFKIISLSLLAVFLGLSVGGEVLEYISGVLGAKRYGASTKGILGAIIGGMLGTVILSMFSPGLGTVIGVLIGTFSGAFLGEYISGKDMISSGKAGWGAFMGRVFAIGIKVLIILAMSSISIWRIIAA
ncbi:MAG: DUF456 domain-containing protein [Elusimicrobiota bacterium]